LFKLNFLKVQHN